jgi:hypothetical protein
MASSPVTSETREQRDALHVAAGKGYLRLRNRKLKTLKPVSALSAFADKAERANYDTFTTNCAGRVALECPPA